MSTPRALRAPTTAPVMVALILGVIAADVAQPMLASAGAPWQATAPAQPSTPANQSPKATPPPADPASSIFTAETGILLVTIKPTAVTDYEDAIRALQTALSSDSSSTRAAAARGWRVFKASESDAKGNAIFIHVMMPAVAEFDYRPSLLLDDLVKDLAPELLIKYQDAFAAPPTKLNLTEFARMSVAPMPPKKPGG